MKSKEFSYEYAKIKNKKQDVTKLESEFVGEIRQKQKSKLALNVKVVEKWIDEFMTEAESRNTNSSQVKANAATALERFRIGRNDLRMLLMTHEQVDRLYKCLFVYSVGFQDVLDELFANNPFSEQLKSRTWITYTMLLEYSHPAEYQNAIGDITKYYKEMMDKATKGIIEEKESYKQDNIQLKNIIEKLEDEKENAKVEMLRLHKDETKVKQDYDKSMVMHENEVALRLEYENKLANITAMQYELENRFMVIAKDSQISFDRQKGLFQELKKKTIENNEMTKENYNFQNMVFKLQSNIKECQDVILQRDQELKRMISDRDKLQLELTNVKLVKNELEKEKKMFDQHMKILVEDNNNLRINKDNNDVQTNYYLKTIRINEENLGKLSQELKIEKFNNENNKNKFDVMQIQINDNARLIKRLQNEYDKAMAEMQKQRFIANRVTIELDTYNQRMTQLAKDYLDLNIKSNLIIKVRDATEISNVKLKERIKWYEEDKLEQEYKMKEMTTKVIKSKEDLIRAQNQFAEIENKFENYKKVKEVDDKNQDEKLLLFTNLLNKERVVSTTYKQQLEDEKLVSKLLRTKTNELTNNQENLNIKLNRREIEYDHLNSQFNFLKVDYDQLKKESNKSKYVNQQSISLADDQRDKLQSIKQNQDNKFNKMIKDQFVTNNKLKMNLENYQMHCEQISYLYRHADEKIGELIARIKLLEENKSKTEKELEQTKAKVEKLSIDLNESQNLISKVESHSNDSLKQKNELEHRVKLQKNREEYFKQEIKKGINQVNELSSTIDSNKKDLESFAIVNMALSKQTSITNDAKEFTQSWIASNKKKMTQTDITGELRGYGNKKTAETTAHEKNKQMSTAELNEQLKRLQENQDNFKLEILTQHTERAKILENLKDTDSCPQCERFGGGIIASKIRKDNNSFESEEDIKEDMQSFNSSIISRTNTLKIKSKQSMKQNKTRDIEEVENDDELMPIIHRGESKTLKTLKKATINLDNLNENDQDKSNKELNSKSIKKTNLVKESTKQVINDPSKSVENITSLERDENELLDEPEELIMVDDKDRHEDLVNDSSMFQLEKQSLKAQVQNSIKYKKRSNVSQLMKASLKMNLGRMSQSVRPTPVKLRGPITNNAILEGIGSMSMNRFKRDDSVQLKYNDNKM